jgi:hypothetical protein
MNQLYIEQYVGHYVTFDLLEAAKQDRTMKLFYESDQGHYVRNKLIAVDQLGIWVEGFRETTIYYDDQMNELVNPKKEWITYHVLIRWEYLQGVFVVENPSLNEKKIGFDK